MRVAVRDPDVRAGLAAAALIALFTALRLAQLSLWELVPDEAYYWEWSRRLAAGYYDQGPLIAYLIRLSTAVFGATEFAVRLTALASTTGTLVCCWALARMLYGAAAGWTVALLLGVTPMTEVGSLIATYDPPLVFFWSLTALLLARALLADTRRTAWRFWPCAGVAAGSGLLSKHTMALLLPCLLLFLLLSPAHRRWLRHPAPYVALLCVVLLYSGVLWWNAGHHWWTFGHLLFLTRKTSGTALSRLGEFLGSQALLFGPGLFLGTLCVQADVLRRLPIRRSTAAERREVGSAESCGPRSAAASSAESDPESGKSARFTPRERDLYLVCLGLPVFLFFCLMTLKAKVQGNWAPCAWLTPAVLLAGRLADARRSALAQWFLGTATITAGALTLLVVLPGLRQAVGLRLPPDADLSNTAYGWREVAGSVDLARREMAAHGRPVFLAGNGYQYPALLAFYLPDHPETHDLCLHFRLTMYAAYMDRLRLRLGQDAVFLDDNRSNDADLRQLFERVEWDPPLQIWRRSLYARPVRTLHLARCYGFRNYIGLRWAEGG